MMPQQPVQNMDPEFLAYAMELANLQPQQEAIAHQRAMVEQLRGGAKTPGMRDTGRTIQAANPLEFMSQMAHAGLAKQGDTQAQQMVGDYGAARRGALGKYNTAMNARGNPKGIVPPTGGGSQYGDDPYAVRDW